MSFLNIADPAERDAIVADYLATIARIKNHNLQEKVRDFTLHKIFEKTSEPVVRTTKESTKSITKELIPIKEGIKDLNEKFNNIKQEDAGNEQHLELQQEQPNVEEEEPDVKGNTYENLVEEIPYKQRDPYFGIVKRVDGQYQMGNVIIEVKKKDIMVAGVKYLGTDGLWALIMLKKPEEYSRDDLETYRHLAEHTNIMEVQNNTRKSSKPKMTFKWKEILSKFQNVGDAIQFLPADIKGLQSKLNYLLGEYRAGNTSATRNQIVAIADELLRRNHLSRPVYRDINNFLQEK